VIYTPIDTHTSTLRPVTTWIGDCSQAGKPSGYVTAIEVDSAFYPLWDGKMSISFHSCSQSELGISVCHAFAKNVSSCCSIIVAADALHNKLAQRCE